ncbi:MAG: SRPBCC family protein [Nitrososphaerota archaeon]|nr:SRPBCC family protein [Nitrososphaerota archaeon]
MGTVVREIEVDAPLEAVWKVVSDIDNEPEYWHGTREVVNLRREGSVTERVVVQNFIGTRVEQRVTLNPEESVEVDYLKGTTVGRKTVSIARVGDGRYVVRASWNVHFTGMLVLITPVIWNHIVRGTENALARIKEAAEGRADAPAGGQASN